MAVQSAQLRINELFGIDMSKFAQSDEIWRYLPVIASILDNGSVQRAADHLRVNRTTVERQLNIAEQKLGSALVIREKGRISPTPLGREILRVYEAARHALDLASGHDTDMSVMGGPLRISAPPHLMKALGPGLLKLAAPPAHFRIDLTAHYDLADLQARQADLAVRVIRQTPEHPLAGDRVCHLNGAMYESAANPGGPFVGRPNETEIGAYAKEHTNDRDFIQVSNIDAQIELIAAGAIGRLPCFIGETDDRVRRVSEILPPENWQVWIVTHESFANSPRIEFAIRTLKSSLLSHPGLASPLNRVT